MQLLLPRRNSYYVSLGQIYKAVDAADAENVRLPRIDSRWKTKQLSHPCSGKPPCFKTEEEIKQIKKALSAVFRPRRL